MRAFPKSIAGVLKGYDDPNKVEFFTDEVDAETEETKTETAAEKMAGKSKPFVVGSTAF